MEHPTILIVDDQPEGADLLKMVLELSYPDAFISVAYSGQAGLEAAAKQRPDAAILDIEMTGMDGVELAFAIRAAFPAEAPLLIALSGNLMRLAEVRNGGPFDHQLSKPADLDALVRMLAQRMSL